MLHYGGKKITEQPQQPHGILTSFNILDMNGVFKYCCINTLALLMNGYSFAGVGYVLSCLPSMSEECLKIHQQIELIRNLKLTPDVIINIKVPLLPPVVGPSVLLPPVVGPSVLLPTSPSTWPSQHTHSIKRYTI